MAMVSEDHGETSDAALGRFHLLHGPHPYAFGPTNHEGYHLRKKSNSSVRTRRSRVLIRVVTRSPERKRLTPLSSFVPGESASSTRISGSSPATPRTAPISAGLATSFETRVTRASARPNSLIGMEANSTVALRPAR